MMKIGPYYLVRDTTRPIDYPPKARDELVKHRLELSEVYVKLEKASRALTDNEWVRELVQKETDEFIKRRMTP